MDKKNKKHRPYSPASQEEDPDAPPSIKPDEPAPPELDPDLIPEENPIILPPIEIPLSRA